MKNKHARYKGEVFLRTALRSIPQYMGNGGIDDRIENLKIESRQHGSEVALVVTFMFEGPKEMRRALVLLEVIAYSVIGYLSLVYEDEVTLISLNLTSEKTHEGIMQNEASWLKSPKEVGLLDPHPCI